MAIRLRRNRELIFILLADFAFVGAVLYGVYRMIHK